MSDEAQSYSDSEISFERILKGPGEVKNKKTKKQTHKKKVRNLELNNPNSSIIKKLTYF